MAKSEAPPETDEQEGNEDEEMDELNVVSSADEADGDDDDALAREDYLEMLRREEEREKQPCPPVEEEFEEANGKGR